MITAPDSVLKRVWFETVQRFAPPGQVAEAVFVELLLHYGADGRFYHNLTHLAEVLAEIDRLQSLAEDVTAVRLAAWFHDVVYDPQKGDNEAQSAAFAVARLPRLNVPAGQIERVAELIRLTQTHEVAPEDADGKVLVDADLAILGQPWPRYWEYAQAIRQEYGFVADALYREGRTAVLRRFLGRPAIYRTAVLFDQAEYQARQNLEQEIALLSE